MTTDNFTSPGPMADQLLVGLMALDANPHAAELLRWRLDVKESVEECRSMAKKCRQLVFSP